MSISEPTPVGDLEPRIAEVENLTASALRSLVEAKPGHNARAQRAAWNIRGQAYHVRRLYEHYEKLAGAISARVFPLFPSGPPAVLVTHSPELQELLFEFYAFMALARISLDELGRCLRPVFTRQTSLPSSITQVILGQTDCPVYTELVNERFLHRIIDLRDCLVHHKSFAAAEVIVCISDTEPEAEFDDAEHYWSRPVTRVQYRLASANRVVVNVLLPDRIYESRTSRRLVRPFAYRERTNLLTQTIEYLRFGAYQVIRSFQLLEETAGAPFTWRKRGARN